MKGAWLLSRRADLLLFGGSTLLALLFLGLGAATGLLRSDAPLWVWLLTVVGVDVAHVWSTGYRVYADAEELARRPALYLGLPLAAWACGVALHALSPLLFWRVLAYLAVFHFVRQQYGWVALYRRKAGETDGRLLDTAAIYASTLAPLLYWHAHLPRRFHWFLAGDFVSGLPAWVGEAAMPVLVGQGPRRGDDGPHLDAGNRGPRLGLRLHRDQRADARDPLLRPRPRDRPGKGRGPET